MSKEQMARAAEPRTAHGEEDSTREDLRRQMEEARESIAQTVGEIKETVTDKYQSVKGSVEGALDWREQFRSHPVAWLVGALAVGYVLGNSFSAALKGGSDDDRLLSHLSALADRFADELADHGMKVLGPVLGGAVLFPVLADKFGEMSGLDLTGLVSRLAADVETGAAGKGKRKKAGGKKQGRKGKRGKQAKKRADAS
jgi:hypothetical protein